MPYDQIEYFLPTKSKELVFLKLNEGFTEQEKSILETRLEKYRDLMAGIKNQPTKLKEKLDKLKPEIVRIIKKKRSTNANKLLDMKQEVVSLYKNQPIQNEEILPIVDSDSTFEG